MIYYAIPLFSLHSTVYHYNYAIAADTVLTAVFLLLLSTYYLHLYTGHSLLFFSAILIISFIDFLFASIAALQILLFLHSLHAISYPLGLTQLINGYCTVYQIYSNTIPDYRLFMPIPFSNQILPLILPSLQTCQVEPVIRCRWLLRQLLSVSASICFSSYPIAVYL